MSLVHASYFAALQQEFGEGLPITYISGGPASPRARGRL